MKATSAINIPFPITVLKRTHGRAKLYKLRFFLAMAFPIHTHDNIGIQATRPDGICTHRDYPFQYQYQYQYLFQYQQLSRATIDRRLPARRPVFRIEPSHHRRLAGASSGPQWPQPRRSCLRSFGDRRSVWTRPKYGNPGAAA